MGFEQANSAVTNKDYAHELLTQMQEPVLYDLKKQPVLVPFLQRIPFVSRFMKDTNALGGKALNLGSSITALPEVKAPIELGQGLHWSGFALAAVDFLLIPAAYLSSYIYGEKVPFTLSKGARWLYSGVLLGLSLTASLVPVAAPPIGIVLGGLSLGLSTFLLGKAFYERYQLGKERKALRHEIASAEEEMFRIQGDAKTMQEALENAENDDQRQRLYGQVAVLKERYERQKKEITELKEKELVVDEKIKELGFIHILDKALAVGFASVALIGLVLSLFMPTVGLPILTGVAAASCIYVAARILGPLARDAGSWVINKIRNVLQPNDVEKHEECGLKDAQEHNHDKQIEAKTSLHEHQGLDICEPESVHKESNSTGSMLEHFLGTKEAVVASLISQGQQRAITDNEFVDSECSTITGEPEVLHELGAVNTVEGESVGERDSHHEEGGKLISR